MEAKKECFDIIFIEQFVDNELSYQDAAAVAAHIKECETCRTEYHRLKQLKSFLSFIAQDEVLSEIEKQGFENVIYESSKKSRHSFFDIFRNFSFSYNQFVSAGVSLMGVIILTVFFTLDSKKEENLFINEMLSLHDKDLPDEFTEKDNVDNIVKANLNFDPKINKLMKRFPNVRGRFDQFGSTPVASIKMRNGDESGTVFMGKNTKELREIMDHLSCTGQDCKLRESTIGNRDVVSCEKEDNGYFVVSDNAKVRSAMARLICDE